MNLLQSEVQSEAIVVSETPEGLAAIHQPDCAAAVWKRRPLPSFQAWIDALSPDQLPRARLVLRTDNVHEATTQICDLCGIPGSDERTLLIEDITATAHIFSELMSATYLALRLEVVTTNACQKFHVDALVARLVCTYRGTGTQYGLSSEGVQPRSIFTVPTGAPVVLRGTLWPKRPNSCLLHRSPPIEGTGETRMVLTLDPVSDSNQHLNQRCIH